MSRKLATIQKITELNPIIGADNIEVASVLGWKTVVRKNEFSVGQMIVYCEVDSFLPIRDEFEFLRKGCYKKGHLGEGFRIKTIRLRGQISQGVCFPISLFSKSFPDDPSELKEGDDVTDVLGIQKYFPQIPANVAGEVKGSFPSFIPKTDETRVQVLQEVLTRHVASVCYVTEKIDGCSVTYYYKGGEFGVCSRGLELKETAENIFWKMAREMRIEEKLKVKGKNIALQGEVFGMGIQKNNLKIPENKVAFFNVFDIDKYEYFSFESFIEFMRLLELQTVPVLTTNFYLTDDINTLVEMAKGFSVFNNKVYREGIVIRPVTESFDMQMSQGFGNGRLSFKVVNPEYLLKFEE